MDTFVVVEPSQRWMSPGQARRCSSSRVRACWDKYFRGTLTAAIDGPKRNYDPRSTEFDRNLVLFGDPQSNPLIAKVLPKLPITWTKDKLVVNGVEYDPKTHVPVMIYPNPLNRRTSATSSSTPGTRSRKRT